MNQLHSSGSLDQPCPDREADRAEFLVLYSRHASQLYGYIRTMVPNRADAEDAFQDVSAVLWEKFDQFQPGTNFAAWATRTAHYAVLTLRYHQRRALPQFNEEFLGAVAEESSAMVKSLEAQRRALDDCYQLLPPADRELIDERYRAGASVKDLADKLHRPLRTVYRLLERVHAALLNCIEHKLSDEEGYRHE